MNRFGPVPLVLAVSGHRDIRAKDRDGLETAVGSIFDDLQERFPNTPLVLLSPLAAGADRIAAKAALARGIDVVVPMPLPLDDYREDFKEQADRDEFETLLQCSSHDYFVGLAPGNRGADLRDPRVRDAQYAMVGAHIVTCAHILIALWNGKQTENVGGTAQVVAYKRSGIPQPFGPVRSPLDPVDTGPVYQIVTPRQSDPQTVGPPFERIPLYPDGFAGDDAARDAYDRLYKRIDEFNADALRAGLDPRASLYRLADTLADRNQFHVSVGMGAIFLLALIAAGVFTAYDDLLNSPLLILANVVSFGAAWIVFRIMKSQRFEDKSQDYRALSIALRVSAIWRSCGCNELVSESYLRKQRGELDWIRTTIRSMEHRDAAGAGAIPLRLGDARAWIDEQLAYFRRAGDREARKQRTCNTWARMFASAAFLLSAALAYVAFWRPHLAESVREAVLTAIALSALVAAFAHNYAEKKAYAEHSKRYAKMVLIFQTAHDQLESDPAQAAPLLADLGREALIENGDWLLLHRERPLELEQGW